MDELVTIPKLTAQIVFDTLVHSMDFGSGFLDTEEVEALRGLAVCLGVDPVEATPSEFTSRYPHQFDPMPDEMIQRVFTPYVAVNGPEGWTTERHGQLPGFTPCKVGTWGRHCSKPENDSIHAAAEMEHDEMGTGHEIIAIDVATILEWRTDSGTVLRQEICAPGLPMSGLLSSPFSDPYRLYGRPADGSAEWREILRFDPLTRDIVRFDAMGA